MEIVQLTNKPAPFLFTSPRNMDNPFEDMIDTSFESLDICYLDNAELTKSKRKHFIEANTSNVDIVHLKNDCVVPVFSKDNEITISHPHFIETVWKAANNVFAGEEFEEPEIMVSHIIKGRTPEAIHKQVNMLLESDKTIYYERMAFAFEVPSIHTDISGNRLNLTIGGVRAYNHENLYSKKGAEKFKVFIGFKNLVCCNMCIFTDGFKAELTAMSLHDLYRSVLSLFQQYKMENHLNHLRSFTDIYMTEHQFAQFLGKARLYQYLPTIQKRSLPYLEITDSQINTVARSYYNDTDFGKTHNNPDISLWRFYNLLTGANKNSYIHNFLDRSVNITHLTEGLRKAITGDDRAYSWFLQ